MRSNLIPLGLVAVGMLACSEDEPSGFAQDTTTDTRVERDSAPNEDGATLDSAALDAGTGDQAVADTIGTPDAMSHDGTVFSDAQGADGGASGWDCQKIYQCTQSCTDLSCIQGCIGNGCPSATQLATALSTCGLSQCGTDCLGGFDATCESCLRTTCKPQFDSCIAHSC